MLRWLRMVSVVCWVLVAVCVFGGFVWFLVLGDGAIVPLAVGIVALVVGVVAGFVRLVVLAAGGRRRCPGCDARWSDGEHCRRDCPVLRSQLRRGR